MKRLLIIIIAVVLMGCTIKDNSAAWGSFEADETIISARVTGTITQLLSREGMSVTKDELIAEIDATDLLLSKAELESNIKMLDLKIIASGQKSQLTETEIQNLSVEQNRFKELVKQHAATQKQLDDIDAHFRLLQQKLELNKTEAKLAKAEKQVANKKLNTLESNIEKCQIKAPTTGTILTTYANEGEFVAMGKPIVKLADISTLKAVFFISETQLTSLKLGQKIKVRLDSGETMKSYPATVSYISSKSEFTPKVIQTREERVKLVYKVEALCNNDGSLKIGMPIEIIF